MGLPSDSGLNLPAAQLLLRGKDVLISKTSSSSFFFLFSHRTQIPKIEFLLQKKKEEKIQINTHFLIEHEEDKIERLTGVDKQEVELEK
ncbi:uncharacterized protein G2W53_001189 [Senna tora]|uniref:Uncharacterized protein n=1 Tax=Senna tora TaxID=362788 RepID=A0A834XFG3_9FABA|nr:uncharacterized protein G2W53_001189 [Senna tora]